VIVDRIALQQRLDRATAHLETPIAAVDLAAFDDNASELVKRAGGKPLRVASKSVRCRALLERVLALPGWHGVMAYTLREAIWLVRQGVTDDVLVAYSSWKPGPLHVGVRRSPVHSAAQAAVLARRLVARPGFRLVGMMSYEAQIAGVGDLPPNAVRSRIIQVMQQMSFPELMRRRADAVAAVKQHADLEFVNGGGTGSVAATSSDPAVTEVTAGSGLYGPTLFDAYRAWQPTPAAFFALSVVRRPAQGMATVLGGGWIASGPAEKSRQPSPYLPAGLRFKPDEGAGEVQTPLLGAVADTLRPGDRVWFRHAKAGELCEHVNELQLVDGETAAPTPTYRGEGHAFLG
jgi:D-serine deaminase-like pyridoxal phosphate-dependent protein